MFRRRKNDADDAAREAERRALFEKLAERPEHVCPFLGLADQRVEYETEPADGNRCYAFGDPESLSHEQQARVCLDRGYGNCPRYLRGILVIPTEEIEALRRPQARRPAAAPPPLPPPPAARRARRARRRGFPVYVTAMVASVVLLATGSVLIAQMLLSGGTGTGPTPTASPTAATPDATASPSAAPTGTASAPATSTPQPTPTPEPTPEPGDRFSHYEVAVAPQPYTVFRIADSGEIISALDTSFGNYSQADVTPRQAADGLVHWETLNGGLIGWSYVSGESGEFRIRAVFTGPQGERRVSYLDDDELDVFPTETPTP